MKEFDPIQPIKNREKSYKDMLSNLFKRGEEEEKSLKSSRQGASTSESGRLFHLPMKLSIYLYASLKITLVYLHVKLNVWH